MTTNEKIYERLDEMAAKKEINRAVKIAREFNMPFKDAWTAQQNWLRDRDPDAFEKYWRTK